METDLSCLGSVFQHNAVFSPVGLFITVTCFSGMHHVRHPVISDTTMVLHAWSQCPSHLCWLLYLSLSTDFMSLLVSSQPMCKCVSSSSLFLCYCKYYQTKTFFNAFIQSINFIILSHAFLEIPVDYTGSWFLLSSQL